MITDAVAVKGDLTVIHLDGSGNIKEKRDIKNTVVTAGKNLIASRLVSNTTAVISHMAVGTSNVTTVAANTALAAEIGRSVLDGTSINTNEISYTATFPAGTGTGSLKEAGLFNSDANGTMLCRAVFSEFNKASADIIIVIWKVTIQ